jgi:hypothetical protein
MGESHRWHFGPPSAEKALGALPVVAGFCRRLGIADIIDRLCPVRDVAIATHGQVIEALVANRLTSPTPLLRVQDWARDWAVPEVLDVSAEALNDDRLGRALDAIAPELDTIVGSVGGAAIAPFGIDVSRLHWDMTSISLFGAYGDVEEGLAVLSYGKPKDRRPDLKQIQTGLAVSADGGIPLLHRAFDGRAGEVNQVVGAMETTPVQGPVGPASGRRGRRLPAPPEQGRDRRRRAVPSPRPRKPGLPRDRAPSPSSRRPGTQALNLAIASTAGSRRSRNC